MPRQVYTKSPAAQDVIAELAHQTRRPVEEVQVAYARSLDELERYASVTAFLPILAKRRAKEVLTRQ